MVTPVVCPRLFEFPTALTFRAPSKHHIVSRAFETIGKTQRQGRLDVHVRSAVYHDRSWKGSASVLASMRWRFCFGKTRSQVALFQAEPARVHWDVRAVTQRNAEV